MPVPLEVRLGPAQVAELERLRDRAAKPHLRERAGAVLKVASGWSLRRVAREGLARPRQPGDGVRLGAPLPGRGAGGAGDPPGAGPQARVFPP